jgi:Replication protein
MTNLQRLSEKSYIVTADIPLADVKSDNSEFSDDKFKHEKRLNRLSAHKKRTRSISEYLKSKDKIEENFFKRLDSCYDYLLFKDYVNLNKIKLGATHCCRVHLLCPMCAIVRAAKQVQLYEAKFKELKKENPKLSIYYVVLTVKNGIDLSERYNHLQESLKKLIARRRQAILAKSGNKSSNYALNSVFANVSAGAYSIEVKKGENSKEWHPHANLLLLSEDRILESEIKAEWKKITKDSKIAYCQVKDDDDKTVFVEIFKYALKFSEMEFDDNFTAWDTLKGRRLMGTFGDFRGLDIEKEDTEIALKDEPYIELFYKYQSESQKYKLHRKNKIEV